MRIAIAGGTGILGRYVTATAHDAGHSTLVLSRSTGTDLMDPAGLIDALRGVDAVIDVSSPATLSTKKARAFFGTVTDNLLTAERAAGVRHHVALSIIGAADVNSGYYAGKALQERKVVSSGPTWSLLRTTQFHEFAEQTVNRGAIAGILVAPKMRSQPIAAADVARELIMIAEEGPQGLLPDLAGPQEEFMPDLVRRYARATGRKNPVLAVTLPGGIGRAMRDGALLPGPGVRLVGQNFEQWLKLNERTSK